MTPCVSVSVQVQFPVVVPSVLDIVMSALAGVQYCTLLWRASWMDYCILSYPRMKVPAPAQTVKTQFLSQVTGHSPSVILLSDLPY